MKVGPKALAVFALTLSSSLGALRAISQETAGGTKPHPATQATLAQIVDQMKMLLTSASSRAPGVHHYYITKKKAAVGVKTQDGKDLLRADFSETGNINSVRLAVCTGPQYSCGHTYPCDNATCGHDQYEITGTTAIWWAKTDDGNDNLYTLDVDHQ